MILSSGFSSLKTPLGEDKAPWIESNEAEAGPSLIFIKELQVGNGLGF